jgi:hypothetical protein
MIPATGTVTMRGTAARHGIQAEFGAAATNVRLGAYYRGGANVPAGAKATIATAGVQKFSNYRGAKKVVAIPAPWTQHNPDALANWRELSATGVQTPLKVSPGGTAISGVRVLNFPAPIGATISAHYYGAAYLRMKWLCQDPIVLTPGVRYRLSGHFRWDRMVGYLPSNLATIEIVDAANLNGPPIASINLPHYATAPRNLTPIIFTSPVANVRVIFHLVGGIVATNVMDPYFNHGTIRLV